MGTILLALLESLEGIHVLLAYQILTVAHMHMSHEDPKFWLKYRRHWGLQKSWVLAAGPLDYSHSWIELL